MSRLALVRTADDAVFELLPSAPPRRVDLPGMGQVSPAVAGWESDPPMYRILPVVDAEVPEGKRRVGPFSYAVDGDVVLESCEVEDIPPERRQVLKSTVTTRLIEAGLIGQAKAALETDAAAFARWFASDKPAVYADDPAALTLLQTIGADAEVILGPE